MLSKVLCFGASDGDDDGRGFLSHTTFGSAEPPGFLHKGNAGVESGEFFANVGKGVGGGVTGALRPDGLVSVRPYESF